MKTELADLVALVAHGTAWLAGATGTVAPDPLADTAPIRRSLRFDGGGQSSARDWLLDLRQRGARRLWLVVAEGQSALGAPPRMLAGFANAGRSSIVVDLGAAAEVWVGDWQVGAKPGAGQTAIWDVTYSSVLVGPMEEGVEPPEIGPAFDRLSAALTAAAELASSEPSLGQWVDVFRTAMAAGAGNPASDAYERLLPERGFSDEARRLLAMAGWAWVFGGMGSWNDVVPEGEAARARYDEVSEELYQAVLHAIEAATNAFSTPGPPR